MSHFSAVKTQLSSQEALVTGLRNLFTEKKLNVELEVHEQLRALENAYDRSDRQNAHVIIRRKFLNTPEREALVDVGFLKGSDGCFSIIGDSWDFNQTAWCKDAAFADLYDFKEKVQMAHDQARVALEFPLHLWNYEQVTLPDGGIQLTLTERPGLTLSASAW